mgnify:FL=1
MKPIIYLDMDGVLADFEGKAREIFGDEWKKEIDRPNWGSFQQYPNWFSMLDPMPDAIELYKGCVEIVGDKNQVKCLTALPHRGIISNATEDKIMWARKHISPNLRVHFGPFARDKQHHVQHEHDVLIDDMYLNIKQWRAMGGVGIHHTSATQSLDELARAYHLIRSE